MSRLALFVGLAALPFAPAAPVPWQLRNPNLVTNGSFEDGPDCPLIRSLPDGSTDLPGWTVTRGSIDHVGPFWEHHDGKRSLDLHGSPGFGGVKQTVKTSAGVRYSLSFRLSVSPHTAVKKKTLAVEVDGEKTEFTHDATGQNGMKWESHRLTFTATKAETVIELYTLETEDPNCGPALDDVRVVRAK